jgi:hypothetical protein
MGAGVKTCIHTSNSWIHLFNQHIYVYRGTILRFVIMLSDYIRDDSEVMTRPKSTSLKLMK